MRGTTKKPVPSWNSEPASDATPTLKKEHDMLSIPPTTDTANCPGWCQKPADHPFSVKAFDGDDQGRIHARSIGALVAVEQYEYRDGGDGTVTTWAPSIDLNIDLLDEPMTVDEAEALALELRAAARFARLLTAAPQVSR